VIGGIVVGSGAAFSTGREVFAGCDIFTTVGVAAFSIGIGVFAGAVGKLEQLANTKQNNTRKLIFFI
jgi:hypothetical protein